MGNREWKIVDGKWEIVNGELFMVHRTGPWTRSGGRGSTLAPILQIDSAAAVLKGADPSGHGTQLIPAQVQLFEHGQVADPRRQHRQPVRAEIEGAKTAQFADRGGQGGQGIVPQIQFVEVRQA